MVHVFVDSERHIAVLTLRNPATFFTLEHWSKAPSVLEKDSLLSLVDGFLHRIYELLREDTFHNLASSQVLHIDNLDLGQGNVFESGS